MVVSGRTVYERQLGVSEKEIEIRIARFCSPEGPCRKSGSEDQWKILEDLGGQRHHRRSGGHNQSFENHTPGTRQALYSSSRLQPAESRANKPSIQKLVKATAKKLMGWLLEVPLVVEEGSSSLSFHALLGEERSPSQSTVSSILRRVPGIINFNWDNDKVKSSVVYSSVDNEVSDTERMSDTNSSMEASGEMAWNRPWPGLAKDPELEDVLPYFPVLQDLMFEVKASCLCPDCQIQEVRMENRLQSGCLRSIALNEVMLLLAHSIADGFGCEDASATRDTGPLIKSTLLVLHELCMGEGIVWDRWFFTAACVYLGFPFNHKHPKLDIQGTAYAAIQYGNLSVIAPWLDLTVELKMQHSFGLIQGKGTIGVLRYQKNEESIFEFQGIEETFAIIETERTEDTSSYVDRARKRPLPKGSVVTLAIDQSLIECDLILVCAVESAHRFLYRVRSEHHSRVVDPSGAIINSIIFKGRDIPQNGCKHKKSPDSRRARLGQESFVYTFEEVLGHWFSVQSRHP